MIRRRISKGIMIAAGTLGIVVLMLAGHGVRADGRGGSSIELECANFAAGVGTTAEGGALIVGQAVAGRAADEEVIVTLGGLSCLFEPLPLCVYPGDMNADGEVNLLDFALFSTCFAQPPAGQDCTCADVNGDEVIDLSDLAALITALGAL